MSLIHFHRFLIASAIAFCIGFAAWEFRAFTRGAATSALLIAIGFLVAGLALSFYLWHLRRFLRLPDDEASSAPRHGS